MGGGYGGGRSS